MRKWNMNVAVAALCVAALSGPAMAQDAEKAAEAAEEMEEAADSASEAADKMSEAAAADTAAKEDAAADAGATEKAVDKSGTNFADGADAAKAGNTPAERLTLGYRLADYAREAKDVRAMVVAAKLVSSASVTKAEDQGTVEGEGAAETGEVEELATASELYGEARELAAGDADLLEQIDMAQSEESKGVVGGAVSLAQYVPGNTTWTVSFNANGGTPLFVGTKRGSIAAVDLKVYDQNGNLVCQDLSHNTVLTCRVNPIWTGKFFVKAINHGATGTTLAMLTN